MQNSFIRTVGLCSVVVLVILLVAARAQEPFDRVQQMSSVEKAIEVVRAVNADEYDYRADHGHFGSWFAVYAARSRTLLSLDSGLTQMPLRGQGKLQPFRDLSMAPGAEVIPGYRLTLLVADDGTGYSVSLHDMKTNGCGLSVFSDQSGLIYQGTIIDCPQIVEIAPDLVNRK